MVTNQHLNLDDEEDIVVPLQRGPAGGDAINEQLCLVGRFLMKKPIWHLAMKDRLAAIWQPSRGVGDVSAQVPLFEVAFWVQVHDVPIGFMTKEVGRVLGNFVGLFLEYDLKNTSDFWKTFMRIMVAVDVRKPLRRGKKINVGGDNVRIVRFNMKNLLSFYYLCGILRHRDSSCELLFDMEQDDGSRGWRPELKVERRIPGENNEWLRNGGGGRATPETGGGRPGRAEYGGGQRSNGSANYEE